MLFSPPLKGLFHPAYPARVVSWFAFVVAIFMGYENGDKQRPTKRRLVQGMMDETDPLGLLSIRRKIPLAKIFLCLQIRFRSKVEWVSTFERRRFSTRQSDGWKRSLRAEYSAWWKSGLNRC